MALAPPVWMRFLPLPAHASSWARGRRLPGEASIASEVQGRAAPFLSGGRSPETEEAAPTPLCQLLRSKYWVAMSVDVDRTTLQRVLSSTVSWRYGPSHETSLSSIAPHCQCRVVESDCVAVFDTLDDFNTTPPPFTPVQFGRLSFQKHLLVPRTVISLLPESIGFWLQTRNHLTFSDGGLQVGVSDQTAPFISPGFSSSATSMKRR